MPRTPKPNTATAHQCPECHTPYRRSARLAAKSAVNYTEPVDTPDDLLLERTRAMFDVLLEERIAVATRDFEGVYWKCRDDFARMFKDLPVDDVERLAATQVVHTLPAFSDQNASAMRLIVARKGELYATRSARILEKRMQTRAAGAATPVATIAA